MRIALFNLDCLATSAAIQSFILAHRASIAFVGLSPPFRRARGGFMRQSLRHLGRSGIDFSNFLACNFVLPRVARRAASFAPRRSGAPSRTIAEMCGSFGIPAREIVDVNAPDFVAMLAEQRIDLIVSCYFDQIFRPPILAVPRVGAVNVHTSLLPAHRGPMPVLYACLDDPPSLGVSVHRLEEGVDTGPILAQEAYAPAAGETVLRSMKMLHSRGLALLGDLLPALAAEAAPGRTQERGSYEGFPTRATITALRRRGRRLSDAQDLRAAVTTPVGI